MPPLTQNMDYMIQPVNNLLLVNESVPNSQPDELQRRDAKQSHQP